MSRYHDWRLINRSLCACSLVWSYS